MQRTRILLSIGDKNMENYFLLFMDNKIARGCEREGLALPFPQPSGLAKV